MIQRLNVMREVIRSVSEGAKGERLVLPALVTGVLLALSGCAIPTNPVLRKMSDISFTSLIPLAYFEQCLWDHGASRKDISDGKYGGFFSEEILIGKTSGSLKTFSATAEDPKNNDLFKTCSGLHRVEINTRISQYIYQQSTKESSLVSDTFSLSGQFHPYSVSGRFKGHPRDAALYLNNLYFYGFINDRLYGAWSHTPN